MNTRCIKDLSVKGKTTKLLEKYLCNLWIRKVFLLPKSQKFDRFKYITIKDSRTIVKSTDEWHNEKILAMSKITKGLLSQIHKEVWKINRKWKPNWKEGQRIWTGQTWKGKPKWLARTWRHVQPLWQTKKHIMRATMRFHLTTVKLAKCMMLYNTKNWQNCEKIFF